MKTKKLTTLDLGNLISRSFLLRRGLLLTALALFCFALSPRVQAVSPPPDGGYAGNNTAEGTNALFSLTTGVWNSALGYQSLYHITTGTQNTGIGYQTLFNATTGSLSVATGSQTLFNNTTGSFNTATGFRALYTNSTGSNNTANGFEALLSNAMANDNTAIGFKALYLNTAGIDNEANGSQALYSNTTGSYNTANGFDALHSNTSGTDNTANGFEALRVSTTGSDNTANGYDALFNNRSGNFNVATGSTTLISNTIGDYNVADGFEALFTNSSGSNNIAIGSGALFDNRSGSDNVALGANAGASLTNGNHNIDIGGYQAGVPGESNTIRIGYSSNQNRTFIAGISGTGVTGQAVVVNGSGQLGVATSSARYKEDIHSMDKASEAILTLRPVTFHYKKEIDPASGPQFGLVAEDVETVDPDLVVRDAEGKPYTVRYEAVNAMLLNEFLKEHKKVEDLEKNFEATIVQQQKEIEALTTGLQKVSTQLELRKPAPQTAANYQ